MEVFKENISLIWALMVVLNLVWVFLLLKTKRRLTAQIGKAHEQACQVADANVYAAQLMLELEVAKEVLENNNFELQKKEVALAIAAEEAQALAQAKGSFLANMSHELRTPLNGILSLSELLLYSKLDKGQETDVRSLKKCAQTLKELVDDILDLSKIESGKLNIHFETFDIRSVVQEAAEIAGVMAKERGVVFIDEVSKTTPSSVTLDPLRIKQILINLLSNAAKFTSEGGAVILLVDATERDGSQIVRCSVSDTGIGIPEDKQEAIFDVFTQANFSLVKEVGGTGLGLAICKNLVELMDGEITVSSKIGIGTNFQVILPVEPVTKKSSKDSNLISYASNHQLDA